MRCETTCCYRHDETLNCTVHLTPQKRKEVAVPAGEGLSYFHNHFPVTEHLRTIKAANGNKLSAAPTENFAVKIPNVLKNPEHGNIRLLQNRCRIFES
ncbi:hypothetical protein Y032_0010g1110 [Ancylostoma ceylanicum]|uniref:Uncharacterized protein n=1 Tax=Ancylostoma ceylanicum TaxID=53326 RepID=A0A016VH51_9BILA|nr:hypothetical protein Y032_0010g1110 [Ancylostoma ceylanicum]